MSAGPIALSRELDLDGHQLFLLIGDLVKVHGWRSVWIDDEPLLTDAAAAAIRGHVQRALADPPPDDLPQRIPCFG